MAMKQKITTATHLADTHDVSALSSTLIVEYIKSRSDCKGLFRRKQMIA
jgi:hypothetical protein